MSATFRTAERRVGFQDGRSMPQVGLGVFKVAPEQAGETVRAALDAGYRRFDLAALYGNEEAIGKALRDSGIRRDDVFLTSKLWNDRHGRLEAALACRESLDRLGLDRIDLYLIHWPVPSLDRYVETWESLLELRDDGLVASIGTSNFLPAHLDRLIAGTGVAPMLNQVELHPTFQQADVVAHHQRLGIVTEAWSPLGRGRVLHDPVLDQIARRHGATVAQVVLRWHVDQGRAVVPKSVTPARIAANIDLEGIHLTCDDIAAITRLDTGERLGPNPTTFGAHHQEGTP